MEPYSKTIDYGVIFHHQLVQHSSTIIEGRVFTPAAFVGPCITPSDFFQPPCVSTKCLCG
jgi:hypothetical protein